MNDLSTTIVEATFRRMRDRAYQAGQLTAAANYDAALAAYRRWRSAKIADADSKRTAH